MSSPGSSKGKGRGNARGNASQSSNSQTANVPKTPNLSTTLQEDLLAALVGDRWAAISLDRDDESVSAEIWEALHDKRPYDHERH